MKNEVSTVMNNRLSCEEFCSLYGEIKDSLYRYALYRLGNPADAEDAVSDAVLAAWRGIEGLKDVSAFSAWLFAILRNTCNSGIKRIINEREKIAKAGRDISVMSENSGCEPGSLSKELSEALDILSDDEREIVILSVVAGLSSKEISDMTGLTAGSVRSKLSRSLTKMREFLS